MLHYLKKYVYPIKRTTNKMEFHNTPPKIRPKRIPLSTPLKSLINLAELFPEDLIKRCLNHNSSELIKIFDFLEKRNKPQLITKIILNHLNNSTNDHNNPTLLNYLSKSEYKFWVISHLNSAQRKNVLQFNKDLIECKSSDMFSYSKSIFSKSKTKWKILDKMKSIYSKVQTGEKTLNEVLVELISHYSYIKNSHKENPSNKDLKKILSKANACIFDIIDPVKKRLIQQNKFNMPLSLSDKNVITIVSNSFELNHELNRDIKPLIEKIKEENAQSRDLKKRVRLHSELIQNDPAKQKAIELSDNVNDGFSLIQKSNKEDEKFTGQKKKGALTGEKGYFAKQFNPSECYRSSHLSKKLYKFLQDHKPNSSLKIATFHEVKTLTNPIMISQDIRRGINLIEPIMKKFSRIGFKIMPGSYSSAEFLTTRKKPKKQIERKQLNFEMNKNPLKVMKGGLIEKMFGSLTGMKRNTSKYILDSLKAIPEHQHEIAKQKLKTSVNNVKEFINHQYSNGALIPRGMDLKFSISLDENAEVKVNMFLLDIDHAEIYDPNTLTKEELKQGFFITPEGLAHRTNPDELRLKKISKKDIETEVTLFKSCVFSSPKSIKEIESTLYEKVKKINSSYGKLYQGVNKSLQCLIDIVENISPNKSL